MRSDVCLILEGTYPYVAGGVSTWVAQILEAMPQIHFSLVYIGPKRDMPRRPKYAIPHNVTELVECFVHDYPTETDTLGRHRLPAAAWAAVGRATQALRNGDPLDLADLVPHLDRIDAPSAFFRELAYSRQAWDMAVQLYEAHAPEGLSFIDFFWTERFVSLPVLNLLRTRLPRARIYHAASTGYAGLLGAKAAALTGAPLLLTEHGLYTRERRLEIFNAEWIRQLGSGAHTLEDLRQRDFFKRWWSQLFRSLSRTAYHTASRIYTLFEANRRDQIADGAAPDRLTIIPNGISVAAFAACPRRVRQPDDPLHIGFVGRVTAIKDVKTLLRALAILAARQCPFACRLLGPLDEEPEYVEECRQMVAHLGLADQVHFLGRVDVREHFADLDVLLLTSVSEGLPFVILEANCAGIPVISTDVGACRELLEGRTEADRALGPSGVLTHVASPAETASALERVWRQPGWARAMGEAGRQRVQQHYDIRNVMAAYQEAYEHHFFLAPPARRRRQRQGA